MSKVKRNEPCPCGSGQKYKHCHEPVDRAANDHRRLLRRTQDGLMEKLYVAVQDPELTSYLVQGLDTFWNGTYALAQMGDLDELEDRGSERFLTWFAFDAPSDATGSTLVERVAADPTILELNEYEAEVIVGWADTRLRPYEVLEVRPGKGAELRDIGTGASYTLHDHAAAKRVSEHEFLVTHIVPVAGEYFIAGAAAHISDDTRAQMDEYLALQQETWLLEHPDSDTTTMFKQQGATLNHFVIALPREEHVSRIDDLLLKGRIGLTMARDNLMQTFGGDDDAEAADAADADDADELDTLPATEAIPADPPAQPRQSRANATGLEAAPAADQQSSLVPDPASSDPSASDSAQ